MSEIYISPSYKAAAFTCGNCGNYIRHQWLATYRDREPGQPQTPLPLELAVCPECGSTLYWLEEKLVWPLAAITAPPPEGLPAEYLADYQEAAAVASISPRAAAALLRLLIKKLSHHLTDKETRPQKNIFDVIGCVFKEKVGDDNLRSALDTVRVITSNAINPGAISDNDDLETVLEMFQSIRILVKFEVKANTPQITIY